MMMRRRARLKTRNLVNEELFRKIGCFIRRGRRFHR